MRNTVNIDSIADDERKFVQMAAQVQHRNHIENDRPQDIPNLVPLLLKTKLQSKWETLIKRCIFDRENALTVQRIDFRLLHPMVELNLRLM